MSRWRDGYKNSREHNNESQHADDWLTNNHSGDQGRYAENADENPDDEHGVIWLAAPGRDCGDEVCIVVIETALHLFQEALLLFRKWHPVPLRFGIDAV